MCVLLFIWSNFGNCEYINKSVLYVLSVYSPFILTNNCCIPADNVITHTRFLPHNTTCAVARNLSSGVPYSRLFARCLTFCFVIMSRELRERKKSDKPPDFPPPLSSVLKKNRSNSVPSPCGLQSTTNNKFDSVNYPSNIKTVDFVHDSDESPSNGIESTLRDKLASADYENSELKSKINDLNDRIKQLLLQLQAKDECIGSMEKLLAENSNKAPNCEMIKEAVKGECEVFLQRMDVLFSDMKSQLCDSVAASLTRNAQTLSDLKPVENHNVGTSSSNNVSFPNYACAVKKPISVIVTPREPHQDVSQTRSDLCKNIDPVQSKVHVSGVKTVHNGGVIIRCDSAHDAARFKQLASTSLAANYDVRDAPALNPRLRVVGFSQKISESELVKSVKILNDDILTENSIIECLSIAPLKKNQRRFQALLQLDLSSYLSILKKGELMIGYEFCRVFDAVELRRCFKCCGFGHFSKDCNRDDVCPRCSEAHDVKACNSSILKCIHCANAVKHNKEIKFDHAVWNSSECFVYKQKLQQFKSDMFNIQ